MQSLPLTELADRCAEESRRFARGQAHDDGFCFEIFRRAVVERAGDAWTTILAQYHGLVRDWIWQHSLAGSIADHDDLVSRAFERFWSAITPAKFGGFPHLSSLLRYLKLCAFAALIDEARGQRSWGERRAPVELADTVEADRVDDVVLDDMARSALWTAIEAALPDPAERLVIYLSTVLGLKPREIARRHGDRFATVEDVYRRKRLALERLRRDPQVRGFWDQTI